MRFLIQPLNIPSGVGLIVDNSKMSKSKGNIVRTETILDAFGTLCPPKPIPSELVILSNAKDLLSSDTPTLLEDKKDQVPQGFSLGSQSDQKEKGALAPGFSEPTKSDRDLFASDILRYFLLREIPFGQDGSFSFDALLTRYNADLANGYGNLVSRTLKMIEQYCDGRIPTEGKAPWTPFADPTMSWDWETLYRVDHRTYSPEENLLDDKESIFDFSRTIALLSAGVALCDSTLTHTAPWKLVKNPLEKDTVDGILYEIAEAIHIITALLYPIMPFATAKVWAQLGLGDIEQAAKEGKLTKLHRGQLKPGTKLGPLSPIFPRADKSLIETMINMENENVKPSEPLALDPGPSLKSATTPAHAAPEPTDSTHPAAGPRTVHEPSATLPVGGSTALTTGPDPVPPPAPPTTNHQPLTTSEITIDDFAKIELRVAQIVVAERIPKADKLLRLEVDLGPDFPRRQILSGIAEHYTPEELIGRRIVVITNLAPRKMRGLESHGMLLAASNGENGKPILATFAEDIALGSRLK